MRGLSKRDPLRDHRVSGTEVHAALDAVSDAEPLRRAGIVRHLLGLASAACLFMTSPLAHADEDITRSFNKNCIGSSALALDQATYAS